jgi:hypothetical protein
MGFLGVFPALCKAMFGGNLALYNAPMTPRQADAAVICSRPRFAKPGLPNGALKGHCPDIAGGRRIIDEFA